MELFKHQMGVTSWMLVALILSSSCSKDDNQPEEQLQGVRDRTFDLYVEKIQAHTWSEGRSEYEGITAGDKAGTLKLIVADDEANYWYDHRIDLEGVYQTKWEGEIYNPTTLNVRAYRFARLNTELWLKQFNTEEDVQAISEEDLGIRVSVAKIPMNDATVTVYAFLRAEEQ